MQQPLRGFVTTVLLACETMKQLRPWQALLGIRSEFIMLKQKTAEPIPLMSMAMSLSEVEEEGTPDNYKQCTHPDLLELLQDRKLQKGKLVEAAGI